jgi:hypothetical protein
VTRRFRRRAGVTERVVGSAVFLADGGAGSLYRLNETGSALWRLLAQPITVEDAVAVFRAAFPDRKAADVRDDVVGLLDALLEESLAEEAPRDDEEDAKKRRPSPAAPRKGTPRK